MRIFKQMCVDFKSDLLFKDTLDYINDVFKKLNITYEDMGFMFSCGFDSVDKVAARYPILAKYIRTVDEFDRVEHGAMSSARTDKNGNYALRVEKSEHQILRELVKKTPRPFTFGSISVFLDNVHWFPQINTTPCLIDEAGQRRLPNAYYPQSYMSNCVTLVKQFDYGKKFNPVWFTIEVGDEKTGIIDTTALEEKLSAMFGKPFGTKYNHAKYLFHFDDKEKQQLAEQDKIFAATFEPLTNELKDMVNNAGGIQHIKQVTADFSGSSRVSGLSLVKRLKKALPPKQYNYKYPGGLLTVEKRNENNHSFALLCNLSPDYKVLRAGMVISGYNFKHEIGCAHLGQPENGFEGIYPNTQEEVEYHVANLASALKKAEVGLSEELLRLYGKSVM